MMLAGLGRDTYQRENHDYYEGGEPEGTGHPVPLYVECKDDQGGDDEQAAQDELCKFSGWGNLYR